MIPGEDRRDDVRRLTYVLVTPARNEESHIARAIDAVLAQTKRPLRWIIVSDGSTDRTEEIVAAYAAEHDFIELMRSSRDVGPHDFGSKVNAFKLGYARLAGEPFDFVGNLDADVSFEPDYFEILLGRFAREDHLGLAGGMVLELVDGEFRHRWISLNSVCGAVQLFRREVFERIGGFAPLRLGGVDSLAEIKTRMHGWSVETFPDLKVKHHRRFTSGKRSIYSTRLYQGVVHYMLGYHPLFQLAAGLRRLAERPRIVGSLLVMSGYLWGFVGIRKRPVPDDVVRFLRSEQRGRLRDALMGRGVRRMRGGSHDL